MPSGRRTKLDNSRIALICKAVEAGLTFKQAAILSGVSESTYHRWRVKGEKAKTGIYRKFWESLQKSLVVLRKERLDRIDQAAKGGRQFEETTTIEKTELKPDPNNPGQQIEVVVARETKKTTKTALPIWTADAWLLERKFPDEFGRNANPRSLEEKDPFSEWLDALCEAESKFGDHEYPEEEQL